MSRQTANELLAAAEATGRVRRGRGRWRGRGARAGWHGQSVRVASTRAGFRKVLWAERARVRSAQLAGDHLTFKSHTEERKK